jgi:DNA-binding CsgD family transcriptional regulator
MYISQRKLHKFNEVVLRLHQCDSQATFITESMSLIRRIVPYENGVFFSVEPSLQLFDCLYHSEIEDALFNYYCQYYQNYDDYLAVVHLMYSGNVLADITLHRTQKQRDFDDGEMQLLKMLGEHMQYIFAKLKDEENAKQREKKQQEVTIKPTISSFTTRESEILLLLAQGLPNKEIGERLFIGSETVKTHLKNLFAKTNVRSRTELLANSIKTFSDE